jgi:hypothetical protein
MGENLCQLRIWQEYNQNTQWAQKKLCPISWKFCQCPVARQVGDQAFTTYMGLWGTFHIESIAEVIYASIYIYFIPHHRLPERNHRLPDFYNSTHYKFIYRIYIC